MKSLKKILKKPLVFIILASLIGVVIMIVIAYGLILPKINSYLELTVENNVEREKIASINLNIANYSKINSNEVSEFSKVMNNLIPEENDAVRFLSLNEIVAKASGVTVNDTGIVSSSAQTTVTPGVPPQTPQPQSSNGLFGQVYAQAPLPVTGQTAPATGSSFSIEVSIQGNLAKTLDYIANMKKADRLVGIEDISILKAGEGDLLTSKITFLLPLSASSAALTPNESISFSDEDRVLLKEIEKEIIYSTSATNNSVGRSDPFK